jgi:hypothetical protein
VGAFGLAATVGWACSDTAGQDCAVGGNGCECTLGGTCDSDLVCVNGTCVDLSGGDGGTSNASNASNDATSQSSDPTTDPTDPDSTVDGTASDPTAGTMTGPGILLDVGSNDTDITPKSGCTAIDLLFVLDGSGSMAEERAALGATNAFTQIIFTLEAINGGGVDYRIGVTDDDDHGFLVPAGWFDPNPWFDSNTLDPMAMAQSFNGAVQQVGAIGGATAGCEHVLSSGVDLLDGDLSGFVRPEALLVLVLVTDVDDYGAYDQMGGNTCGLGCTTPPPDLGGLLATLVALKGGQMDGIAAMVVAGDPNMAAGVNFCNQPGSCGCGAFDCDVFHATRLYDFAGMLGTNGIAADICGGPASVPNSVDTALNSQVDLACQMFEPEG